MNEKLMPCPFCGGEAHTHLALGEAWAHCSDCGGSSPNISGTEATETEAEAIAAWNTRAPSPGITEGERQRVGEFSDSEREQIREIAKAMRFIAVFDAEEGKKQMELCGKLFEISKAISQQPAEEWTTEDPTEDGVYAVEIEPDPSYEGLKLLEWKDGHWFDVGGWDDPDVIVLRHGPKIDTTPPNKNGEVG